MFDTTSAMGRFFITLVGAMAQWEREQLAERVVYGMEQAAKEGGLGKMSIPLGYIEKDEEIIVDLGNAKTIERIFDMYVNENKGLRKIAIELNRIIPKDPPWSPQSIRYMLNNGKTHCDMPIISENEIMERFSELLSWDLSEDVKKMIQSMKPPGNESAQLEQLQSELAEVSAELDLLLKMYLKKKVTEERYEREEKELTAREEYLKKQIGELDPIDYTGGSGKRTKIQITEVKFRFGED